MINDYVAVGCSGAEMLGQVRGPMDVMVAVALTLGITKQQVFSCILLSRSILFTVSFIGVVNKGTKMCIRQR